MMCIEVRFHNPSRRLRMGWIGECDSMCNAQFSQQGYIANIIGGDIREEALGRLL